MTLESQGEYKAFHLTLEFWEGLSSADWLYSMAEEKVNTPRKYKIEIMLGKNKNQKLKLEDLCRQFLLVGV